MRKEIEKIYPDQLVDLAVKEGINRFVVGAIIGKDGKVLLLKRKAGDFMGGIFEFPSGKVEENENLIEALKREINEETGLQTLNVKAIIDTFDYESKSGKKTRQFNFDVTVNHDEIILSSKEHEVYTWISKNEFEQENITDSVKITLRKYWENIDARE